MPNGPVITDRAGTEALAARIRDNGRFTLDFEFFWERTYRPVPCLAQVSVGDEIVVIDPIAGADLAPIAELVADPDVATIMHAPSADLTLLALHFDVVPARLADVQLIAGFVGMGAGQSLATLLERALRIRLAKTESFSDWMRRPLTEGQLAYARADVAHLADLHDELMRRVVALDRAEWVAEEHERRYGTGAVFVTDPDEAWRKIKGQGRMTPREKAVLKSLGAWREREAARRDRPPGWLLQDRIMIDLARRRPTDRSGLTAVRGVTDRLKPNEIDGLLAAVAAGDSAPEIVPGAAPSSDLASRLDVLGALGQLLVGVRADAARLAAPLLATRGEIEAFLMQVLNGANPPDSPLASGWRRALAGDTLVALAEGRLALAPSERSPYLEEIARD